MKQQPDVPLRRRRASQEGRSGRSADLRDSPPYEPREDSFLLQKHVRRLARGVVLDMGTGSGIQALTAAARRSVKRVWAADCNPRAVAHCRKLRHPKIRCVLSDLFSAFCAPRAFDTIIFNPPYLPADAGETADEARALSGGKHGWELLGRFLAGAGPFLRPDGRILIVFSSLTGREKVEQLIGQHGFAFKELAQQPFFFERLYCYTVRWNPALRRVMKRGVRNVAYFTRGKRGLIFTGMYRGKRIAIKIKRPESAAEKRIANEARWLKRLNAHGIGPGLLFAGSGFVAYRFVDGGFLLPWIGRSGKNAVRRVLRALLGQCFVLDRLNVSKEEMHHPTKHIIITKRNEPVLLDFERTHRAKKPQNVTQFVQYLCRLQPLLARKGFAFTPQALREAARRYKRQPDRDRLEALRTLLT